MNRRLPIARIPRMPRNPRPRMTGSDFKKPSHWPYYPWCWNDWYYDDWYDWEYDDWYDWEYDYDWMEEASAGRKPKKMSKKNRMGTVLHIEAPLMMSLLEYTKNETPSEMELQHMVSRMIDLCEYGNVLGSEYYEQIVPTPTVEKKE